jgi:hypothetical protein
LIVEVTTFHLAPGVDERAFLDADAARQAELSRHPEALVRRTTARGAGGEWLELVLWWQDPDGVGGAASAAFDALVDPTSRRTSRFETLD